jgi:hypothetical protein
MSRAFSGDLVVEARLVGHVGGGTGAGEAAQFVVPRQHLQNRHRPAFLSGDLLVGVGDLHQAERVDLVGIQESQLPGGVGDDVVHPALQDHPVHLDQVRARGDVLLLQLVGQVDAPAEKLAVAHAPSQPRLDLRLHRSGFALLLLAHALVDSQSLQPGVVQQVVPVLLAVHGQLVG